MNTWSPLVITPSINLVPPSIPAVDNQKKKTIFVEEEDTEDARWKQLEECLKVVEKTDVFHLLKNGS